MLECKDCVCYDTEACRYGRYALEHNMCHNCDDFIVEHNKAYQQGKADGIDEFVRWAYAHGVDFSFMGKIKEDGTSDVVDRLNAIKSDFYTQKKEEENEQM